METAKKLAEVLNITPYAPVSLPNLFYFSPYANRGLSEILNELMAFMPADDLKRLQTDIHIKNSPVLPCLLFHLRTLYP